MPLSDLVAPTSGRIMRYNGSVWVPVVPGVADLHPSPGVWAGLPYVTGWVDEGSAGMIGAQYRKTPDGIAVEMRGVTKRVSGASDIVGTLPVGFRPLYPFFWVVQIWFGAMVVSIPTNGQVSVTTLRQGGSNSPYTATRFDTLRFAIT